MLCYLKNGGVLHAKTHELFDLHSHECTCYVNISGSEVVSVRNPSAKHFSAGVGTARQHKPLVTVR